jgi:uncharacterized protein
MKRIGVSLILVILTSILLMGCGQSSVSESNTEGQKENTDTSSENNSLKQTYLNLGATSQSSAQYSLYVAIADSVKKATDGKIDMTVVETGAALDNLARLQQNSIELGMADASTSYKAFHGMDDWKDKPRSELRNLFNYLIVPHAMVVTLDSGVEKLSDLDGKTFFPGFTGTTTERGTMELFEALNIKPNYLLGGLEDGVNAVKDRRAVGLAKSGNGNAPDPNILEINTTLPLKPIGFSEEDMKIINSNPDFEPYTFGTIPAGSYPNQEEDVVASLSVAHIIADTDLSEEVAYHIFKAVVENKEKQEAAFAPVKDFDYIDITLENSPIPLHSGVVKYLKEKGVEVPEHLIPPEAK